jgi:hypothetical protein
MKTISIMTLVAGLASASAATAQTAPETPVFVDVSVGSQTQSRTLDTSSSFPLYGETAAINTRQQIDGGPFFDISGGYRVTRNVGIAIGVSTFSRDGEGTAIASIPNPLVFARPATVTLPAPGLKHSELGTHLMAVFFVPLTGNLDVALSVGPSFIRLKQDVTSVSVAPNTQNATINVATESATAKGVNVGVDTSYMFHPNLGVGVFLRYAGGTVDLPSVTEVKVGGFQVGAGARLRF